MATKKGWPDNVTDAERVAARDFWLAHPSFLLPGGSMADIPKVLAAAFDLDAAEVAELLKPFAGQLREPRPGGGQYRAEPSVLALAGFNAETAFVIMFAGRDVYEEAKYHGLFDVPSSLPDFSCLPNSWHATRGGMWVELGLESTARLSTGLMRLFAGDAAMTLSYGPNPVVLEYTRRLHAKAATDTYLAQLGTSREC